MISQELKSHKKGSQKHYKPSMGPLCYKMAKNAANASELWETKKRLDFYFENGLSALYHKMRDQLYPSPAVKKHFINRAACKLDEICVRFPELLKSTNFLDICAAPGSWSLYLLESGERRGSGVTIKSDDRSFQISPKLEECPRWENLSPENGDITDAQVYDKVVSKGRVYDLIVADGAPPEGGKDENLQELYASRLILSEIATCFETLKSGGNFVVKFFDTFTNFSTSAIYLLTTVFEKAFLVKPPSSRLVNSERYMVCTGFRTKCRFQHFVDMFVGLQSQISDETVPNDVYPMWTVSADLTFMSSYCSFRDKLAKRQIDAIKLIIAAMDDGIFKGIYTTSAVRAPKRELRSNGFPNKSKKKRLPSYRPRLGTIQESAECVPRSDTPATQYVCTEVALFPDEE